MSTAHSITLPPPSRSVAKGRKAFTMDDLKHRLDTQDAIIQAIRGDTTLQATALQGIQNEMINLTKNLNIVVAALGKESEDGQGNYIGTGLLGRTRRVERAQRTLRELYHRWIAFGVGFCFCLSGAIAVIWWLLENRLSFVLRGTGHA